MKEFDGMTQEELCFDSFIQCLKQRRCNSVKVLNQARYRQFVKAGEKLEQLLAMEDVDMPVDVHMNPEMGFASLTVELPSLTVTNMPQFFSAVITADNMEVYPLVNGNIRMALMYYRMFVALEHRP